jgi:hypothetical protein
MSNDIIPQNAPQTSEAIAPVALSDHILGIFQRGVEQEVARIESARDETIRQLDAEAEQVTQALQQRLAELKAKRNQAEQDAHQHVAELRGGVSILSGYRQQPEESPSGGFGVRPYAQQLGGQS